METEFFTSESVLTDFMPLPRAVLGMKLSSTAALMYAALLDRATLSRKNSWTDELGRVYVIFTVEHLAKAVGRGESAVESCLRELEGRGLIERKRRRAGQPSHIFLRVPTGAFPAVGEAESRERQARKTAAANPGKPTPNELKKRTYSNKLTQRFYGQEDESEEDAMERLRKLYERVKNTPAG